MAVRPQEFWFVALCKTLIEQGIKDQSEVGMMSRVLRLPVLKNPTDVLQWLFKTAPSDKLLGNATGRAILRPMWKFRELQAFPLWAVLFPKRAFQFMAFAAIKGKSVGRIYLILHFYAVMMALNIEWMSKTVSVSTSTIVLMGQCELRGGDGPEASRGNRENTARWDQYKDHAHRREGNLELMEEPDTPGSTRSSGSRRSRKPTTAEVKARILAAKNAGTMN
jgi:hypothetical protein